jgi:hypothetical protein
MHKDIEAARRHYLAMRALISHHPGGREDDETLSKLQEISQKAAAAIDDVECKALLWLVDGYGADLFSDSGHRKWVRTRVSGADFLRLQILKELDAFHARLFQLEVARNAAAIRATHLRPDRRSSG